MRVLWLNHRDIRHPQAGGAERTQYEVSRRLVDRGNEVRWLTVSWSGAPKKEYIGDIEVVRIHGNLYCHARALPMLRSNTGPDIVIDDLAHVVPWFSPQIAKSPGVAFFRHLHARTLPGQTGRPLALAMSAMERLYPYLYRKWPFVTESTDGVRDLEELGIQRGNIFRIPPGVDESLFHPVVRASLPTLVFFSGLRAYKRPDHPLFVLRSVRRAGLDVRLIYVGDGPELASIKRAALGLGVQDYVEFRGKLSTEALARTVGSSWVNLVCSVSEGWSLAALEAASCGVPTVAYNVPGLRDSVADGASGMLVPDGDLHRMAEAVSELLCKANLWEEKCRAHARRFDWSRAVDSWVELMNRLLAGLPPTSVLSQP